jgi:hypothetical protein
MICADVFARCVAAISQNKLIVRESAQDKEFHFQNWFEARLGETHSTMSVEGAIPTPISVSWLIPKGTR